MAKAVVLLFLLDSIPDFNNVMNTTLHKFAPGLIGVTCNPAITAPVLEVIGKKLNLTADSVEKLQTNEIIHKSYPSYKFQELSPESLNNLGFFDNSIQLSYEYSLEKHPDILEHNYIGNKTNKDIDIEVPADVNNRTGNANAMFPVRMPNSDILEHNYIGNKTNKDIDIEVQADVNNRTRTANAIFPARMPNRAEKAKMASPEIMANRTGNAKMASPERMANRTGDAMVRFPESAPFLAAIFETVGNVTAQTCGGVVVARRWVLTAASCVNVLGPFYSNSSNETTDNYYSVVIGAKNPLKDGSVHQVSAIYLHPAPNEPLASHSNVGHGSTRNWFNSMFGSRANATAPSLALLRIDPGVEEVMLPMIEKKTDWNGVSGRMYGWILEQKETGFVMKAISLPTKQLNPVECKKTYGIVENNITLCLSVNDTRRNSKVTRMISGCPVVVVQNDRLELQAVALNDGTEPLLAGPLLAHRAWLRKLTLAGK